MSNNNQQAFLELIRAGLWEKEARLLQFGEVDYAVIMRMAQEQAVVGLVTAGLEHVVNVKIPQAWALQFAGQTIQLEQRNKEMNQFIADLILKMRDADIYTLLVKGQEIAQCYERPLWRSNGDVDFFLSKENYYKAKSFLKTLSSYYKPERQYSKEMGYYIESWFVEIHASQRTGLSTRLDSVIDEVQKDLFYGGNVRSWNNNGTAVFLPSPDNDVFIVFTHFIKHFYKGGQCLRQICDLCRLIWTYRASLNHELLETRIRKAGLMSEWKAFASVAVDYMGMSVEVMPLYSDAGKWGKRAEKVIAFILKGGKWRKVHDTIAVGKIFPMSVLRFAPGILLNANWLKIKERIFHNKID